MHIASPDLFTFRIKSPNKKDPVSKFPFELRYDIWMDRSSQFHLNLFLMSLSISFNLSSVNSRSTKPIAAIVVDEYVYHDLKGMALCSNHR